LNLNHLDFDIVSNFVLRISDFASLGPSTTVENSLQISSFMQNKANLPDDQMNVTKVLTKDYENKTLGERGKNKANSKPIKPNFPDTQMNVSKVLTKDYENIANCKLCENKANTNPIQTQTKPIYPPHAAKQTQYKPNQSQFQTKYTLCEFFLFFIFLCPNYNLAMNTRYFATIILNRSVR